MARFPIGNHIVTALENDQILGKERNGKDEVKLTFFSSLSQELDLPEETLVRLYAHTAGDLGLARTIVSVTGTHGVVELMGGSAVTEALGRELAPLWKQLGTPELKRAALAASMLQVVTPLSLDAAMAAYQAIAAEQQEPNQNFVLLGELWLSSATDPVTAEPEQLIMDLVDHGILVPADRRNFSHHRCGAGWAVPPAKAQGFRCFFPPHLERRKLRSALLTALSRSPELLGEQLLQARKAGRWPALVHLLASRYNEVFTDFVPQGVQATHGLPRAVEQQAPLLKFMRIHLSQVLNRLPERGTAAEPAGASGQSDIAVEEAMHALTEVASEIVLEARSLRSDFLTVLKDVNETAVTAGYAMFALHSQGRFAEAAGLSERAQDKIDGLVAHGRPLTKQAVEFFHYHSGVSLGLNGDFSGAVEQFDAAASPSSRISVSAPARFSAEYGSLIRELFNGHGAMLKHREQAPSTTGGEYLLALRRLDVLDVSAAEGIIHQHQEKLPTSLLWPLLTVVEHWSSLLKGDDHRWSQRTANLYSHMNVHIRSEGLPRYVYLRLRSEVLLAAGRLQQVKSLLDEAPPGQIQLCVPEARMWLAGGQFQRAIYATEQHAYSVESCLRDRAELKLIAAVSRWAQSGANEASPSLRDELWVGANLCSVAGSLLPLVWLPKRYRELVLSVLDEHPLWQELSDRHPQDFNSPEAVKERLGSTPCVFPEQARLVALTEREMEILRLLRADYSLQEIAEQECRALSTVKKQSQAVYRKLGVNGRAAAVQRANAIGIF